jgi:hypothetical protein
MSLTKREVLDVCVRSFKVELYHNVIISLCVTFISMHEYYEYG